MTRFLPQKLGAAFAGGFTLVITAAVGGLTFGGPGWTQVAYTLDVGLMASMFTVYLIVTAFTRSYGDDHRGMEQSGSSQGS